MVDRDLDSKKVLREGLVPRLKKIYIALIVA